MNDSIWRFDGLDDAANVAEKRKRRARFELPAWAHDVLSESGLHAFDIFHQAVRREPLGRAASVSTEDVLIAFVVACSLFCRPEYLKRLPVAAAEGARG